MPDSRFTALARSCNPGYVCRFFAFLGAIVFILAGTTAAQQPEDRISDDDGAKPIREVKLSSLLPATLADFVKKFGRDRDVSVNPAEVGEQLEKSEPDAMRMIEQISPKGYFGVPGPVALRAERVRPKSSTRSSGDDVLLLAGTEVVRDDGSKTKFADQLVLPRVRCQRGEICEQVDVSSGLIFNGGDGEIVIEDETGIATLAPGEAIYVIPRETWEQSSGGIRGEGGVAAACSVSCGSGYYACCNQTTFWEGAKCKCIQSQASANCGSGGPGSASCSIAD